MATTRRQFLATTAALPLAGVRPAAARPPAATADAVVFILMTGGPSQLDTFDPKPAAPADVRGPFRPIPTRTPGVQVSELFPRLAAVSDKWSLIRSMTSDAPPVHEIGMQLVNTGRRFAAGDEDGWPCAAAVAGHLLGSVKGDTRWERRGRTPDVGGGLPTGDGCGFLAGRVVVRTVNEAWLLDPADEPVLGRRPWDKLTDTEREFLSDCRLAVSDVEDGCRAVTVNMFPTVFDAPSWDCHADGGCLGTDLGDYRDTVAPLFDRAVSRLLTDLHDRGLLDRTLVVATGEFGRTPKLNSNGGRDHWTGCWSTLVAGGGVRGGRVVGRSDATASEPADRPVTPAELVATIFHAVGVPADATVPGPDGEPVKVYNAEPVRELF